MEEIIDDENWSLLFLFRNLSFDYEAFYFMQ